MCLGLDTVPGLLTFIGVPIAIIGLFMVGIAKQEEEKIQNSLENINYTKLLREYEMGSKPVEIVVEND